MRRLKEDAEVVAVKESEVMPGRFYITAKTQHWGEVKYVSTKKRAIGDKVVLQDQKLRNMTDMIRWQEVRK